MGPANKIDWKAKLSSRKFWALLAGLATAALAAANSSPGTVERVVALIGAFGASVGYMLGEGIADGRK